MNNECFQIAGDGLGKEKKTGPAVLRGSKLPKSVRPCTKTASSHDQIGLSTYKKKPISIILHD